MARGDFRTLCKIWNHASITRTRKVYLYVSLIESRLLYSLSSCCFTAADLRRLDGFQARCLRKLVGIAPSYISRVPNSEVLRIACHPKASTLLADQQVALLGKVLRAPEHSLLHRSAMIPGTLQPATSKYVRRVGRPRREWVTTVMQIAHCRAPAQELYPLAQDGHRWRQEMTRS